MKVKGYSGEVGSWICKITIWGFSHAMIKYNTTLSMIW